MSQGTKIECHVERIGPPLILGEGPHWDVDTQKLYYVDIDGMAMWRYDPQTGKNTKYEMGEKTVSLIVPVEGKPSKYVISWGRELVAVTWDGEDKGPGSKVAVEPMAAVEPDLGNNRFNDGKVDLEGRLWAGTMPMGEEFEYTVATPGRGCLYTLDGGKANTQLKGVGISNGLDWTRDWKSMYFIDSILRRVDCFDVSGGKLDTASRRTVFDFQKNGIKGVPDGLTMDTEGKLWVACFNGYQVIRIDPANGKLLGYIPIPAAMTTSVAFGGPNLDVLYVTSASLGMTDEQRKADGNAGALFRVTGLGVTGYPGRSIKLD
ncbi:regucalcin [Ischnura elegans]|uniref:regucalcin n=1 Tax=Ischnura elegans TaxID=197161 RepID=UPI001ED86C97|nr:regucalcin [Ischnura elegans]XP_046389174.1 regucalcin [Ischnura elegans]